MLYIVWCKNGNKFSRNYVGIFQMELTLDICRPNDKWTEEGFKLATKMLSDTHRDQIIAWQPQMGLGPYDAQNRLRKGLGEILVQYQERHIDIFTVVTVWTDSLIACALTDLAKSGRPVREWIKQLE